MNKAASIVLLSILLLSQLGVHLFVEIHQWIVKEEQREAMLKQIPQKFLTKFEEKDKLEWEEADREFYYQGSLYDVSKITTEKGTKIYWAIKDSRETEIILKKIALIEKQHKNTSDKKQSNFSSYWQLILFNTSSSSSIFQLSFNDKPAKCWKQVLLAQCDVDYFVPPPQPVQQLS